VIDAEGRRRRYVDKLFLPTADVVRRETDVERAAACSAVTVRGAAVCCGVAVVGY